MTETLRGTSTPLRQRISERYSPTNGFETELEWSGFNEAQIRAYASQYAAAGCEYEFVSQNGRHTLVARRADAITGNSEVTIDTWELAANTVSVSVFRNPILQDESDPRYVDPMHVFIMAFAYERGITTDEAWTALKSDTLFQSKFPGYATKPVPTAASKRLMQRVFVDKTDSYLTNQYVLRHTTNVSNRWSRNVSDSNVNCYYSTAHMLSELQDANLWIYPLPGRLAYKIMTIPPKIVADHFWGWLKSASTEVTAANNRVQITTEFNLGAISTDEYDAAA